MNEATQTTRGFNVIFIHSSLDDAGLTPQQFRVLAHITRRAGDGSAWASNEAMADVCRIDQKTVISSLLELEGRAIIKRTARPGKTTLWKINPPSSWDLSKPKKPSNGRPVSAPTRTTTQPEQPPCTQPEQPPTYPTRTTPHEGNSLGRESPEGNQKNASALLLLDKATGRKPLSSTKEKETLPEIPGKLKTEGFLKAWSDWLSYRAEIRKPISRMAAERQFSQFLKWGAEKSVEAIDASIMNCWQGVFEPKGKIGVGGKTTKKDFCW